MTPWEGFSSVGGQDNSELVKKYLADGWSHVPEILTPEERRLLALQEILDVGHARASLPTESLSSDTDTIPDNFNPRGYMKMSTHGGERNSDLGSQASGADDRNLDNSLVDDRLHVTVIKALGRNSLFPKVFTNGKPFELGVRTGAKWTEICLSPEDPWRHDDDPNEILGLISDSFSTNADYKSALASNMDFEIGVIQDASWKPLFLVVPGSRSLGQTEEGGFTDLTSQLTL